MHNPTIHIWELTFGSHGKKTIALGVPLTYPPRPINGLLISDFLAPNTDSDYTYPSELKNEIKETVGEYIFDTREFRTENKEQLLADIYAMTKQRFELATHLATTKEWDFFMMVEMGPDRIHHGFWKFFDEKHNRYEAGHPLENAIRDYYIALDKWVGNFIEKLPEDTLVLVVSDHGAKRMDGGLCFNDWLIQEGYLVLKETPNEITKFNPNLVDWEKTRAWGDGGYYGRCFLNIESREPNGIVAEKDVEALKKEITEKLEALTDEHGKLLNNKVFRSEKVYTACNRVAPDLILYPGDLHWRSVGTVGNPSVWTHDNDTGPDDANHAQHGIFLMAEKSRLKFGASATLPPPRNGLSLYDVAPTVLKAFGIVPPKGMGRNSISSASHFSADLVYTEAEEAELSRRLEDLGYL